MTERKYDMLLGYVHKHVILSSAGFTGNCEICQVTDYWIKVVYKLHASDMTLIVPIDKINYLKLYAPKVKK